MASKASAPIAFLLSLNLLFFTLVSSQPPSPPPPSPRPPIACNLINFRVCANILGLLLVNATRGPFEGALCCSTIGINLGTNVGLTTCLCRAVSLGANATLVVRALSRTCGGPSSANITCG